jgi:hypothetical protein
MNVTYCGDSAENNDSSERKFVGLRSAFSASIQWSQTGGVQSGRMWKVKFDIWTSGNWVVERDAGVHGRPVGESEPYQSCEPHISMCCTLRGEDPRIRTGRSALRRPMKSVKGGVRDFIEQEQG